MRVLWLIDGLGPGGAEHLMPPLLMQLKDHVDPRVCVLSVRAGNPHADELEKIGIPVDLIQVSNLRDFSHIWQLLKYIRQQHPDIIHTQLETSDVLGTLSGYLFGIPSISTIHTLEVPSRKIKKYWRNFFRWNCLKYISKSVIVVSEFTRQHYIELGFRAAKLHTLYNGITPNSYLLDKTDQSSKADIFGFPNHCTVLTTVAVLREPKGIQHMLQAMPELIERVPNLRYVIVGDGPYREFLENLSRSLGIAGHITFMGYRTDIPQILAASDLFVYPTLKDALPTVLLEAMAAGVPIVASQIGGIPEILEHDVSGWLVPPTDPASLVEACLRLVCDRELASRLTTAARSTLQQRFDIHQQAIDLLSLYKQIGSQHEH